METFGHIFFISNISFLLVFSLGLCHFIEYSHLIQFVFLDLISNSDNNQRLFVNGDQNGAQRQFRIIIRILDEKESGKKQRHNVNVIMKWAESVLMQKSYTKCR